MKGSHRKMGLFHWYCFIRLELDYYEAASSHVEDVMPSKRAGPGRSHQTKYPTFCLCVKNTKKPSESSFVIVTLLISVNYSGELK